MSEGFFAGNFEELKDHWEDLDRAEKFKSGGTRSVAVRKVVKILNIDIHQHSWLDTGTGAGYIQMQVDDEVDPVLFVGLDFSKAMIYSQKDPYGPLIIASSFKLPFRNESFSVVSNFFSLSDYPEPISAFQEFSRIISRTGSLYFVDYAKGDDYWERRKSLHGSTGNDNKLIVGDINLRSVENIQDLIPNQLRIVHSEIIEIKTDIKPLKLNFDLPKEITRKFLFVKAYKPRSKI